MLKLFCIFRKYQIMQRNTKVVKTILSIDTSCDDTSAAVTYGRKVLSNVISSQVELHAEWGGVVPGLAKQEHEKRIDSVLDRALKDAGLGYEDIDAFAVTQGPGLAIALEVGVKKAKELALKYNKPLIPVNHMEGHLFSSLAIPEGDEENKIIELEEIFPALGVLISGGHTILLVANGVGEYKILGETLDDAIGESFDKVAKILDLGYPGGPIVSKFAEEGNTDKYALPVSMKNSDDFNVSYSGLKTAVLYLVRDLLGQDRKGRGESMKIGKGHSWKPGMEIPQSQDDIDDNPVSEVLGNQTTADICASFQNAAIETLLNKAKKALNKFEVKSILLGGGVVNNTLIRKRFKDIGKSRGVRVLTPQKGNLFMDNAAMIGVAAYLGVGTDKVAILDTQEQIEQLDRDPGLCF